MDIQEKLQYYFGVKELEKEILEYFGFPNSTTHLVDSREDYWLLTDDCCYFYERPITEEVARSGAFCRSRLFGVYRKDRLTLICTEDSDQFLAEIYDNEKECRDLFLIELCKERWG